MGLHLLYFFVIFLKNDIYIFWTNPGMYNNYDFPVPLLRAACCFLTSKL